MSFTTDAVIAEANRNQAQEAVLALRNLRAEIGTEVMNAEDDDVAEVLSGWQNQITTIIELVRAFEAKHQPELSRCK